MSEPRFFVYLDGDDVGARIELLLLKDDADGAAAISRAVVQAIGDAADRIQALWMGTVHFAAGDELLASVSGPLTASDLDGIRHRFEERTGLTISCGVGSSPAEAARMLHLAKLEGKNRTVGPRGA